MAGLRKYIRPYYSYMLLAMFIKFFGALVELLIPYLLETILDDVVPTGSRRGILLTGGAMVLCAALCVTANIVANRMSAISAGENYPGPAPRSVPAPGPALRPAAGRVDPALRCVPSHQ